MPDSLSVAAVCLSLGLPVSSCDRKCGFSTLYVQTYHTSFICELARPFRQYLQDVPVFLNKAGFFFVAPGYHSRIY